MIMRHLVDKSANNSFGTVVRALRKLLAGLLTAILLGSLLGAAADPAYAGSEFPASVASPGEKTDEGGLLGPLRLRDLTPFALQRLDFLPTAAAARYPESWAFEANLSYTNTFIMSGNVAEYLENRGSRAALTPEDFAALAALPEDAFYFDGAVTVLNLTAHRAVSDSFAVYGILPIHHYSGGFLDGAIETFHHKAGYSDFGRPYVARNQFQTFFKVNGRVTALLEAPATTAIADPVIGARWRGLKAGEWDVVFEAAAKLPIGADNEFFSSGHGDVGLQVSWQREWLDDGLFISVANVYFGGSDSFGDAVHRLIPSATIAWEHRLEPGLTSVLQMTAARSMFKGETDPELSAVQYQLSLGLRWRAGEMHYTAAITENMFNFQNTPDIGFHFGAGWSF